MLFSLLLDLSWDISSWHGPSSFHIDFLLSSIFTDGEKDISKDENDCHDEEKNSENSPDDFTREFVVRDAGSNNERAYYST